MSSAHVEIGEIQSMLAERPLPGENIYRVVMAISASKEYTNLGRGLSCSRIADKLGISRSTLYRAYNQDHTGLTADGWQLGLSRILGIALVK